MSAQLDDVLYRLAEVESYISETLHGAPILLYRSLAALREDVIEAYGGADKVPEDLASRLDRLSAEAMEIGLRQSLSNQERVADARERKGYYKTQLDQHMIFAAKSLMLGAGAASLGCIGIIADAGSGPFVRFAIAEAVRNFSICIFVGAMTLILNHISNSYYFYFYFEHAKYTISKDDAQRLAKHRRNAHLFFLLAGLCISGGIGWFIHTIWSGSLALAALV
ncbi:MAG: hypothetical protein LDL26_03135 [Caenispirillum bisanense]|nr:hypothetical protein [Caenispirillum bisanense]MCA1972148.1 hypothetical protein [Caenispirillum sp.]